MKLGLLLTATIKVQCIGGQFSPDKRLSMYSDTLSYYANKIGDKYPICFVENSDYDLNVLKKRFYNKLDIEFLQFSPATQEYSTTFDAVKGKGYNEYLMIKLAILKSQKINRCTHFLKITGRYAMENIVPVIHEIEKRCNEKLFMGDIKDTNLYEFLGINNLGHWGDSRFWVSNVEYYKNCLSDCYLWMDDSIGKYSEDFLYDFSMKNKHDKRFVFRFKNQVRFDGFSGSVANAIAVGGNYNYKSRTNRIKAVFREILRYLFPNFWF